MLRPVSCKTILNREISGILMLEQRWAPRLLAQMEAVKPEISRILVLAFAKTITDARQNVQYSALF
jgi:hypothetical protein